MSKPGSRRRDRLTWARDRDEELLQLYIRLAMEHQANAAAWERWQKPYFEFCPENAHRDQNQRARAHLSQYLDETEASDEADGHLGARLGLRKRSSFKMATLSLKIVDYQRLVPGDSWLLTAVGSIPPLLKKGFK